VFAGDGFLDAEVNAEQGGLIWRRAGTETRCLPEGSTGKECGEAATVVDVGFAGKEDPAGGHQVTRIEHGNTHQFLGRRIVLAELKRQGSAYVGELRILRA